MGSSDDDDVRQKHSWGRSVVPLDSQALGELLEELAALVEW